MKLSGLTAGFAPALLPMLALMLPVALSTLAAPACAQPVSLLPAERKPELMSFVFRDAPIAELFEMISRKERINIMLARGITGNVSVNLYDMSVRQAIYAIAEAGGYTVAVRGNGYMISETKDAPVETLGTKIEVRSMKVQYSDPKQIVEIVQKHLSKGGKVTLLEQRRMLIVEDTAEGLDHIAALMKEIDTQPQQIMIEAKILEITLDNDENFGIDWNKIFSADGASRAGTQGLTTPFASGLFFNVVNSRLQFHLNALNNKGRVHTLSTPKLLTLENQEAVTEIGDKLGYKLTTTINNVTTESVQFLETGVILRVTPSVDADGHIALKIRPEVSSGSVTNGIPSKKTTEVTTQVVAEDGQAVLIAGLIKKSSTYRRQGVPVLGDLPFLGAAFSNLDEGGTSIETIVLITPHIVGTHVSKADEPTLQRFDEGERHLMRISTEIGTKLDRVDQGAAAEKSPP